MTPELFLKELCETKPSGVMATVLSVNGHGPANPGDKLFWTAGKLAAGTVGGGSNEQQVLEACAKLTAGQQILTIGSSRSATFPPCGGALQILLEAIDFSDPAGESFWKTVQQLIPGPAPHIFLTLIAGSEIHPCHVLADETGMVANFGKGCREMKIPPALLQQFMENEQSGLQEIDCHSSQHSFFIQPLNRRGRLFLIGAGHVAREVAWLADRTGFQVTLIDPRRELMGEERFPAGCNLYLNDAAQFFADKTIGPRDYLVIAGPDHAADLMALGQAGKTSARYIGVMGSGKKIGSFEKALRKKDLWQALEGRLHAPIGIPIPSKSPAEVAVSIVAELIQVRNKPVIKQ
ncbi:MAG: XdhC family protein [Desulfocapsa sp.]|nr:XdhC family protein [Desulfocapsa sp.]